MVPTDPAIPVAELGPALSPPPVPPVLLPDGEDPPPPPVPPAWPPWPASEAVPEASAPPPPVSDAPPPPAPVPPPPPPPEPEPPLPLANELSAPGPRSAPEPPAEPVSSGGLSLPADFPPLAGSLSGLSAINGLPPCISHACTFNMRTGRVYTRIVQGTISTCLVYLTDRDLIL